MIALNLQIVQMGVHLYNHVLAEHISILEYQIVIGQEMLSVSQ